MLKSVLSYFWGSDNDTDLSLDDAYKVLETPAVKDDEVEIAEISKYAAIPEEYACNQKTGIITAAKKNKYTIDNTYEFTSRSNFTVGTQVTFMTYIVNGMLKISNVNEVDSWNVKPNDTKSAWCSRTLVCKVTERNGRQLSVEPENIIIDLDLVASEFVPIVGDWLQVEVKAEFDENVTDLFGKILEVESIQPLRPRIVNGRIKYWSDETKTGIIDAIVFFNGDALPYGYIPKVGDMVVTEIIESQQGRCSHRSLKILSTKSEKSVIVNKAPSDDFQTVNENVSITDDVCIAAKEFGEKHNFTFEVCNESPNDLILLNLLLPMNNSLCTIIKPEIQTNIVIKTNESIKCEGVYTVKNIGTTRQQILFCFSNFKMCRWITINLESKYVHPLKRAQYVDKGHMLLGKIAVNRNKETIKGRTMSTVPRFINVTMPDYPVPKKLLQFFINFGKLDYREIIKELQSIKPCLTAPFTFENYEDRFHTLLHLEEIHYIMSSQIYTQDRVCFIRNGEYLMLEIENLAERRPSLMVGDRIFAVDPSKDDIQFEGFIHKVVSKYVYLKFSSELHDTYDGRDMSIRVVLSRTAYCRMHQAVALIVRNCCKYLIMPSKIVIKPPQVKFTYEPYHNTLSIPSEGTVSNEDCSSDDTSIVKKQIEDDSLNNSRNKLKAAIDAVKKRASLISDEKSSLDKVKTTTDDAAAQKFCLSDDSVQSQLLLEPPNIVKGPFQKIRLYDGTPFKLEWYNKNLNFYQKEAVRNILLGEARPLPYFIFGPPGTGKTVTLVETILQLLRLIPHSRILVATPSNSAADLITLRLIECGILKPGDLIRLIGYRYANEITSSPILIPYCATIDIAKEGTRCASYEIKSNGLIRGCNSSVIGRHRITVATCVTIGTLYRLDFSKGHFTHIIIDEAGQATEPEVMIPMSFLDSSSGQAILAGDHLQLGPVILSRPASFYGLSETYLDRVLNRFPYTRDNVGFPDTGGYDPRLITRLIYNYRSLPDILNLFSNIFYGGELISTISPTDSSQAKLLNSVKEILPCREGYNPPGVVFHGVTGENYQTEDCPSWFNPNEASQVFFYVNELYRLGIKSTDIGIISPYLKQVQVIRSLLNEADFDVPKIGTVEEFQGQEFNVILISTVRSNSSDIEHDLKYKLGFISNSRRLNVSISRGQALIIIIGNPHLLCKHTHWQTIIKYCVENGAYCGCDLPVYD